MENQRLLLAALLSAILLVVWNYFFLPVPVEQDAEPVPGVEQTSERPDVQSPSRPFDPLADEEESESAEASKPERSVQFDFAEDRLEDSMESVLILETERVVARFTNRGAKLLSFQIKKQADRDGKPLEFVRKRGEDVYPFGLVDEQGRSHPLNTAGFVGEKVSDREILFRYRGDQGTAEKRYSFDEAGMLRATFRVGDPEPWGILIGPGVRETNSVDADSRFLQRMASYHTSGTSETIEPKKQEESVRLSSSGLQWVGLEDNFFLAAALPESGWDEVIIQPVLQNPEAVEGEERFSTQIGDGNKDWLKEQQLIILAEGGELSLRAFLGSKEYSRLSSLPYGLEETVRWGWFGFLARPLYYGLEWIYHNVVANYGWAIVLITFLIKLIFFPLTHKSQKSMAKMQELNPKVQSIRNKYRSKLKDKQGRPNLEAQRQMNEEMMSLYKSAGVNPASGCLPILLQMPVFFAFYRLLSTAVELRNAPWLGWIQDLSVPDPYYLLPIVMGVSSIFMQKMMPSSPDPMQRRIMQLMPIMFMFFAFAFPSGLVLYWVTNNLLTMVQQAVLLKRKEAETKA